MGGKGGRNEATSLLSWVLQEKKKKPGSSRLCVLSLRVLVWGTPPPGCMEAPHRVGVRVKGVRPSAQQRSWQIASSTHHPCERTGAPGFWPQPLRLPAETPDMASKGRIPVPAVDVLTECPTPRNCER